MAQGFASELLGEITEQLVQQGLITGDQLEVAKVTKQTLGGDLGNILIKKGFITTDQIRQFLQQQLELEQVALADLPIDGAAVKSVPLSIAEKYHFMPLYRVEDILTIAVSDPLALFSIAELQGVLSSAIHPILATQEEIDQAIKLHYQSANETSINSAQEESIHIVRETDQDQEEKQNLEEQAARERVVAIVNTIITRAVKYGASDIHIEPQGDATRVRCRMDGMLQEMFVFPKALHLPLVSRLKVMGSMDIAERRIPQDGRVRLKVKGNNVDLRLSTYPTMFGEKMVMRLLIKSKIFTLDHLGFAPDDKQRFTELIAHPHGIFLVTGPTGSGKSSTLYAVLQRLNSQETNIVSIEDPVENEIPGVNQAQVNVKAGMTFASALRSILRQDPDIIMVGEVRDRETAEMAVRAALTGHLVLSTLHTNTAAGVVERLCDMGVERFLIASALIGVLAQRLVRKICPACRAEVEIDDETRKLVGDLTWAGPMYRGRGCRECRMTGFRGRCGIFELMTVDNEMRQMITKGDSEHAIQQYCIAQGWRDMRTDGLDKVKAGITTLDEVLRATSEE
ncbi:MAG: type II/IV secretion system protein [Deltaproteobacteria bacterium]|nr:type II/IV secretion system protein [Deltaproteobacteria bacterium]